MVVIDKPNSSIQKLKSRCLWGLLNCQSQFSSGNFWWCPKAISNTLDWKCIYQVMSVWGKIITLKMKPQIVYTISGILKIYFLEVNGWFWMRTWWKISLLLTQLSEQMALIYRWRLHCNIYIPFWGVTNCKLCPLETFFKVSSWDLCIWYLL